MGPPSAVTGGGAAVLMPSGVGLGNQLFDRHMGQAHFDLGSEVLKSLLWSLIWVLCKLRDGYFFVHFLQYFWG